MDRYNAEEERRKQQQKNMHTKFAIQNDFITFYSDVKSGMLETIERTVTLL
jgi:hypothetical protein